MTNLQLITSTIHSLELNHLALEDAEGKTEKDKSFDLSHQAIFPDDDKRMFANSFKLHLEHPGEFTLVIEYISWFHTDEDIDEVFQKSPFVKINAPAIAYPYLRSTVSTLTLLAGFPVTILPTINFVQFNKVN